MCQKLLFSKYGSDALQLYFFVIKLLGYIFLTFSVGKTCINVSSAFANFFATDFFSFAFSNLVFFAVFLIV